MNHHAEPWQAHWLWAAGPNFRYRRFANAYALFRLELELPEPPISARVRVTADTRFRLWVNGASVLRGPARGYPESWPYDEIDLAEWLVAGTNVLAIQAHCIGDYTFQSEFGGRPGVLLDGQATLPGGSRAPLHTHGATWTATECPAYRQHVGRSSVQTGWQEELQLAEFPAGWLEPGGGEGFSRPADLGRHPQPPWLTLEPRGIPLLNLAERLPERAIGTFAAAPDDRWREVVDLSEPLTREDWQPAEDLADLDGDRVTVAPASGGATVAVLFDLGLTCLGYPSLTVTGPAGAVIDLAYAERLLPSGFVATRPPEDTQPRHVDRFCLREGTQTLEVFNPRGYRYLAVIVRGANAPVEFDHPRLEEIRYPAEQLGELSTGDALLDRIWNIGLTTLRRNMTDAYTDCPWREQAQWWGDARVEFLINAATLGDTALLARGIRQGAQSMLPNGLMYGVFPGKASILPDYNFVWAETLWDHFEQTGSDALLRQWGEHLRRNLAWFRDQTDDSALLVPPEGTWLFLDWAPLFRGKYSTVYNLRYLQALAAANRIFAQLGWETDADAALGRGMMTAMALTRRVFNPETGAWHDGFDPETGERLPQLSAHAQALAILLGLEPQSHARLCEEILIPVMRQERDDVVPPSPFFSAFVLEALVQKGYQAQVLEIIRQRWGVWIERGLPTWPEEWDENRLWNLSLCHAWSGAPTYLLSWMLLGVRLLEPGWKRILLAPRPHGLAQVSGAVPTPRGAVEVAWEVAGQRWQVRATVPDGIEAVVDLGDGNREVVAGGRHRWEVTL